MALRLAASLLLALVSSTGASSSNSEANPIRRIVTLLQNMQKEVQVEGEKQKELFEKFMCFCEGGTKEMTKAAEDAKMQMQQLSAEIEANTAEKARIDQELVEHKEDREEAKAAIAKATKIREKEHAAYTKEAGEMKSTVDAINKAIPALEKGMSGGAALLQAGVSRAVMDRLRNVAFDSQTLEPEERQEMMAFFSVGAKAGYAPQSGQIVGILKQMKDDMDKDLGGIVEAEESAQKSFEELVQAKTDEIQAATGAIEDKTERSGALAVAIVQGKADYEDTTAELGDAEKYMANLAVQCETKEKEWAIQVKTRNDEIVAIGEAISVLNDDDALDTFKKTLPTPGAPGAASSFMQGQFRKKQASPHAKKAMSILQAAASVYRSARLDRVAYALRGKKVSFDKVIKLIDDMVVHLAAEQKDDDAQKEFCQTELDTKDDQKKELTATVQTLGVEIDEAKESIAQLTEELATLEQNVKDLDHSVAAATEQRKEENADFAQAQTELNAATQLIEKAKNKLYKFYNPALYKPPPKRELSAEEAVFSNLGGELPEEEQQTIAGTSQTVNFLQKGLTTTSSWSITSRRKSASKKVAPPEAPEGPKKYEKKSGKSQGVIALMDMLKKDLETEAQEAAHDEKTAQSDYNRLMEDSATQRQQYASSIANDSTAKADLEGHLQEMETDKKANRESLAGVKQEIGDLHQNCDFLLENYDFRQTARQTEMDALKNAKAALKGAKFD